MPRCAVHRERCCCGSALDPPGVHELHEVVVHGLAILEGIKTVAVDAEREVETDRGQRFDDVLAERAENLTMVIGLERAVFVRVRACVVRDGIEPLRERDIAHEVVMLVHDPAIQEFQLALVRTTVERRRDHRMPELVEEGLYPDDSMQNGTQLVGFPNEGSGHTDPRHAVEVHMTPETEAIRPGLPFPQLPVLDVGRDDGSRRHRQIHVARGGRSFTGGILEEPQGSPDGDRLQVGSRTSPWGHTLCYAREGCRIEVKLVRTDVRDDPRAEREVESLALPLPDYYRNVASHGIEVREVPLERRPHIESGNRLLVCHLVLLAHCAHFVSTLPKH